jgi:zinc and cadmium transporter
MVEAFWPIVTSLLACSVTMIGIYMIRKYEEWGKKSVAYFMCFASGVLISVSFLHIVPESFEMNTNAPIFLLAGYLFLHLTNRFFSGYVCDKLGSIESSLGPVASLGIGFHSFVDGIVYSVTFSVSILTGALAAFGLVLHEFPEGVVTFLFLRASGLDEKKSTIYAIIAAAITTPLGTLISYPLIGSLEKSTLGALLAFSAGALIYVGATHLLPEAEKEGKKYSLLTLAIGILVAILIIMSEAG